ncbi:helix-turn-helix domain-containing protein [Terasakiella pusilla]|uniref:helix-turn-helix domain-containing protein n=1 Tax=Terasakiella pusilla TaxID=64973 RepID=UPI003AA7FC5C
MEKHVEPNGNTALPLQRPFTPKDLATRWQCSERHIRNLAERGEIPFFKIGNLYRFNASDIGEYECASKSTEDNTASTGVKMASPKESRSARTIIN